MCIRFFLFISCLLTWMLDSGFTVDWAKRAGWNLVARATGSSVDLSSLAPLFENGDLAAIKAAFEKYRSYLIRNINQPLNAHGDTMLHLLVQGAGKHGNEEHYNNEERLCAIIFVLENGANVNAQNETGWTPLHYAAQNRADDLIKIFLLYGGDPDLCPGNAVTRLVSDSPRSLYSKLWVRWISPFPDIAEIRTMHRNGAKGAYAQQAQAFDPYAPAIETSPRVLLTPGQRTLLERWRALLSVDTLTTVRALLEFACGIQDDRLQQKLEPVYFIRRGDDLNGPFILVGNERRPLPDWMRQITVIPGFNESPHYRRQYGLIVNHFVEEYKLTEFVRFCEQLAQWSIREECIARLCRAASRGNYAELFECLQYLDATGNSNLINRVVDTSNHTALQLLCFGKRTHERVRCTILLVSQPEFHAQRNFSALQFAKNSGDLEKARIIMLRFSQEQLRSNNLSDITPIDQLTVPKQAHALLWLVNQEQNYNGLTGFDTKKVTAAAQREAEPKLRELAEMGARAHQIVFEECGNPQQVATFFYNNLLAWLDQGREVEVLREFQAWLAQEREVDVLRGGQAMQAAPVPEVARPRTWLGGVTGGAAAVGAATVGAVALLALGVMGRRA
jgi:hypothetical protein